MTDCYIVARTTDVTGRPLPRCDARVQFDGGVSAPLSSAGEGIAERLIPPGTSRVQIDVAAPDPFWPASQIVIVDTGASPPTIRFEGDQQFNTRAVRVVTRGARFNLEVHFTVGQLMDVTDSTRSLADGFGYSYDLYPQSIDRFGTPLLKPAGSGSSPFNRSRSRVTVPGRLMVAARRHTPKLIAIGYPGWNPPANPTQARLPIPFHVFFHPSMLPGQWPDDPYPNGPSYLGLISRYLISLDIVQYDKGLIYQNGADGPKSVLVFPVGSLANQMGDIVSQSAVVRLLDEVAFYIQRVQSVAIPLQRPGSVSLSGFSAGANFLRDALTTGPSAAFRSALRNVFVFDGVVERGAAGPTREFAVWLGRWINNASAGSSLRVYTQSALWFNTIQSQTQLPIVAGPERSREAESPRCSLLYVPASVWQSIIPGARYPVIHQRISSYFVEHAVTNSSFSD